MKESSNAFAASIDALISPDQAFNTVKDRKGWSWIPFIFVIVAMVATYSYYFSVVDAEWLQNQNIEQITKDSAMTDGEIEAMRETMSIDMLKYGTLIGGPISLIVISLIFAVYLNIASKVSVKSEYTFTQWFGFTWWANMPVVVACLVSILVIVFAPDGKIAMQDLQPASLNSLVLGLNMGDAWYGFAEAINVFTFWSILLTAVGLKAYLDVQMNKAVTIAILPSAVIYIGWALYIVFAG